MSTPLNEVEIDNEYRIDHQGHDIVVQKKTADGWENVRSFNELSDDWAYTNAREYITYLKSGKRK
jgi:hypothetical protein